MDQLVAVNRSNWKVVFRSNDNRIVLYNQHLNEFRTTDSTSTQPGQWSSISYFHILENYLMNNRQANYLMNQNFCLTVILINISPFKKRLV